MEPAELPDDIYEQIEALSEAGNNCADDEDWEGAIEHWRLALGLLPEPAVQWEAATWLYASLGDAYYQSSEYDLAKDALYSALNGPDGQANPFVHYMLGKTLWRLDEGDKAIDALLRAYMLDGVDIFDSDEDEGPDCLQLLEDRGLVDD